MQDPLFLLSHPVSSHPFLHSDILQQTLIQTGRDWYLVDKVHHFNRFYSKLRDCRGDTSDWMNAENQSDTPFDTPFGTGGEGVRTVTVEGC